MVEGRWLNKGLLEAPGTFFQQTCIYPSFYVLGLRGGPRGGMHPCTAPLQASNTPEPQRWLWHPSDVLARMTGQLLLSTKSFVARRLLSREVPSTFGLSSASDSVAKSTRPLERQSQIYLIREIQAVMLLLDSMPIPRFGSTFIDLARLLSSPIYP